METAGLFVSFSIAVQHAKNYFGVEKLVLKSKQVNVLKHSRSTRAKTALCGSLLAMVRVCVTSF